MPALAALFMQNAFAFEQVNDQVYINGTANKGGTHVMTLVADNTWEITANFADSGNEHFKFSLAADGSGALGDNEADGMVEPDGADIAVSAAGNYKITYNSQTNVYRVYNIDAVKGDQGSVTMNVNGLYLEDGVLSPVSVNGWDVYLDGHVPFGGPGADYRVTNGEVTVTLAAGSHTARFYRMTGSHSYVLSNEFEFVAQPNKHTSETFAFNANPTRDFKVYSDVPSGKALYISGASSLLGNWKTAYKMDYQNWCHCWNTSKQLPAGLQYKVVMADWVDNQQISTENVDWESGNNRNVMTFNNDSYPQF